MPGDQPLSGVSVIDCASLIAGPMVGTLMSQFGADVVKIEHPEYGDGLRHHGEYDEDLMWKAMGQNRKSVPVDLHHEEGQEVIHDLVKEADVFVENFRPGRLEEWNLGWETLSEINPDLVMVRVTGFGQTGPYRDRPGFGTLAEAMSGFAYMTGQPDGPPTLPPFGLADAITGLYATAAATFALYWRDTEDGTGQYVDASIFEAMFAAIMHGQTVEYAEKGIVGERMGNRISHSAPRNTYQTGDDQWVAISASAENIAKRVLRIVGGEELVSDPRFQTMRDRVEHVEELDAIIQDWMAEHTREEAVEIFTEHNAAIAPVYSIADIFQDEHVDARDLLVELEDEELGEVTLPGVVPRLSETPGRIDHPGPRLGKQARDILTERTSLTDEELAALEEQGIIAYDE